MNITDIVNRDIVSLDNCESEPIHIPGSIQPHGFLLGVEVNSMQLVFCSGNIGEFISIPHDEALGKPLQDIIPASVVSQIDSVREMHHRAEGPVQVIIDHKHFECLTHISGATLVLEFIPSTNTLSDGDRLFHQASEFIHHIEYSDTLQSLCQYVVDSIRHMSGYVRVMVYRFDEQYNGEVFAESCSEDIEPFLGLHYPHTDIPVQARALYEKNLLRQIVDINYDPVPIYTIGSGAPASLDLSHACLRSVSPIHVRYLQNMGVGATLTISLLQHGKLWGLITCHHYGPKQIDHATQVRIKLQGHFLASQIRVRETNEEYIIAKEVDAAVQILVTRFGQFDRKSIRNLIRQPEMLSLCRATGVALIIDDKQYAAGSVPGATEISQLLTFLAAMSNASHVASHHLNAIYPPAVNFSDKAAGVLYYSLGGPSNGIIWFRHETTREVHWGGDPKKAILKDENGLHPRKSFERWKEIVKGTSLPWLKPEIIAAENVTYFLQRQVHLLIVTEEEFKYRELSHKLQEANAELENINWISAHDLKEPLRKIQVFASRILDSEEPIPPHISHDVTRMKAAAERMQALMYDILSYSRVNKATDILGKVSLQQVVQEAVLELQEEMEESKATITTDVLPEVQGVSFLLKQLFLNLFRNAMKFTRAGVDPVITVSYTGQPSTNAHPGLQHDQMYHAIRITDNGIGFDNQYKDNIFDVFTRLHTRDKFGGSGVGLAMCKKIMQNHNGLITAHGEEGVGAEFTVYFPVINLQ